MRRIFYNKKSLLPTILATVDGQNLIELNMKRQDEGKVSFVEFLRSIKFAQHSTSNQRAECPTHFAHLNQRARGASSFNTEDSQLIRSAN